MAVDEAGLTDNENSKAVLIVTVKTGSSDPQGVRLVTQGSVDSYWEG